MAAPTKEDMDRVMDAMRDIQNRIDYFQNMIHDMPNKEQTEQGVLGPESSNEDFRKAL